jgi:hypothetical protein
MFFTLDFIRSSLHFILLGASSKRPISARPRSYFFMFRYRILELNVVFLDTQKCRHETCRVMLEIEECSVHYKHMIHRVRRKRLLCNSEPDDLCVCKRRIWLQRIPDLAGYYQKRYHKTRKLSSSVAVCSSIHTYTKK